MNDLIDRLRLLEIDHAPDGWPAVRMRDVTALLDALEAARVDAARVREMLRTVSAVGVAQLFDVARDDVLEEFSLADLEEIARVTDRKRPEQVERIYREGWDAARGEGGV